MLINIFLKNYIKKSKKIFKLITILATFKYVNMFIIYFIFILMSFFLLIFYVHESFTM